MRPPARALALGALLVVSVLAGCASPAADAPATVAYPALGDEAEYRVSGNLLEFTRWAFGAPVRSEDARLTLTVTGADGATDGFGAFHPAYRVAYALDEGGGASFKRAVLVSAEHAAVVQSETPLSTGQSAIGFDERGYPWAWGASVLAGRVPTEGDAFPFTLPANAGQDAPLELALVVEARETVDGRDAWRARVAGLPDGVAWHVWVDPEVPVPVRVRVTVDEPSLVAPFVRWQAARPGEPVTFSADLAAFTRGSVPVPPRDSGRDWLDEPVSATFDAWDGEVPPEGAESVPFRLHDAIAWAKSFDPSFQAWLGAHAESRVYRATYFQADGPAPGTVKHAWLVQYVGRDSEYYELQVERVVPEASALVPGLTQVTSSGVTAPPEGAHGWFPADALPDRLLTLASGIALVQAYYPTPGVEIFLRSFTEPTPGYAYYIDGGFHEPEGRYTVIVNAQSGFLQAAVGPVEPLTTPVDAPPVEL